MEMITRLSITSIFSLVAACATAPGPVVAPPGCPECIRELPPIETMDTLGAWHLEEGCTGSIVMLRREYYWVSECDPSDPMPEKTYGFPLHQRGESWYTSEISGISFCIQEDGSLIMRSEGDPDFHADPAP